MTFLPRTVSREAVGSSARISLRIVGQGPGNGHPLLFAAGEQGGQVIGPFGNLHVFQKFHNPVLGRLALDAHQTQGNRTFCRAVRKGIRLWA